jgi:pseudouridine synthase
MTVTRLFKYHKPVGVLSTTCRDIPHNIIDAGMLSREHKNLLMSSTPRGPIVPIGRPDKDSSGLLLLTNSDQIITRLLRTIQNPAENKSGEGDSDDEAEKSSYGSKFAKVYEVSTLRRMTDEQLDNMRKGVKISTMARNMSGVKNVRPTLPIGLERVFLNGPDAPQEHGNRLIFTLREGRNRQIRKMVGRFGHTVVDLKRVSFGGVTLEGIEAPGKLSTLTAAELRSLGIKALV